MHVNEWNEWNYRFFIGNSMYLDVGILSSLERVSKPWQKKATRKIDSYIKYTKFQFILQNNISSMKFLHSSIILCRLKFHIFHAAVDQWSRFSVMGCWRVLVRTKFQFSGIWGGGEEADWWTIVNFSLSLTSIRISSYLILLLKFVPAENLM